MREMNEQATIALDKLRSDLKWCGPNGRKAGHVVIPREAAHELLKWLEEVLHDERCNRK